MQPRTLAKPMADEKKRTSPTTTAAGKPRQPPHDVVLMHSRTEDGTIRALRSRPGRLDLTELRPAAQGKPINGEMVRLRRREEHPLLWDVEVQYNPRADGAGEQRSGPPAFSTAAYRRNWEAIFGERQADDDGELN